MGELTDCGRSYPLSTFTPASCPKTPDGSPTIDGATTFHEHFDQIAQKHSSKLRSWQIDSLQALGRISRDDLNLGIDVSEKKTRLGEKACFMAKNGVKKAEDLGDDGVPLPSGQRGYSRSEVMVAFAGQAIRDGADLKTICSVLASQNYAISAHVYDAKNSRNRLRPIHRAVAEAICTDGSRDNSGRPIILAIPGRLSEIIDAAEQSLLNSDVPVYQRGGEIVQAIRLDASETDADGVRRVSGTLVIRNVDKFLMAELLTRVASWRRPTKDGWVSINCSTEIAQHYLSRSGDWRLPVLRGIIEAPTLRKDGSMLSQPGYDAASGLILGTGGQEFPPVPDEPSRSRAEAALRQLLEVTKDFPFVPDGDDIEAEAGIQSASRSVALSAMLTGLVRRSLRSAPLHGCTAPTMGTGKSLLADCVALMATGRTAVVMSQGKDETEDEKRQLSILRQGDPIVVIDNVMRPLAGDALCSILTQEMWQGRVLGVSQMLRLPTNVLFMATGNNLAFRGDMRTRGIMCRLDAGIEQPEKRRFDVDLKLEVPRRRPQLVAAALTILRAFVVAGRPGLDRLEPFGRFEDWSDLVRGALVWLGQADPCETRRHIIEDDPEKEALGELLLDWAAAFGSREPTAGQAIKAAYEDNFEQLTDAMAATSRDGRVNPKSLGWFLQRHEGEIANGQCFRRRKSSNKSGARIRVENAAEADADIDAQLRLVMV